MNKTEVVEIIGLIKGAYGNKFEVNEHTAATWARMFEHEDYTTIKGRVYHRIGTMDFPPSISDLLQLSTKGIVKPENPVRTAEENEWFDKYAYGGKRTDA